MGETAPITFLDLMALEALGGKLAKDALKFASKIPSFNPGGGTAYGGHVYAQSVWAASKTVEEGMVVHNVHGYFTLPGLTDRPYIYTITHLSEGRSYCTRSVTVRQPTTCSSVLPDGHFDSLDAEKEAGKICFGCICSFKRDEVGATSHQVDIDLGKTYGAVIKGKPVEIHKLEPHVDAPWYYRIAGDCPPTNFPGLEMRRVDMSTFNESKPPIEYRQLSYYRRIGTIPPESYNLHACAHLYASDRNSLYVVSNALGFGDQVGTMGSLSHSVVFHVSSKDLVLNDGEWWCQESWTPRSGGGRGMYESRIWDKNGVHVASSWQDGLVRKAEREEDQKQKNSWIEGMERIGMFNQRMKRGFGRYKL